MIDITILERGEKNEKGVRKKIKKTYQFEAYLNSSPKMKSYSTVHYAPMFYL